MRTAIIIWGVTIMLTAQAGQAEERGDDLRQELVFYASFDEAVKADIAGGQNTLNTRFNHPSEAGKFVFEEGFNVQVFRIAKDRGISGGALEVASSLGGARVELSLADETDYVVAFAVLAR